MSPLLAAAYVIFVLTVLYLLLELRRHLDAMFGITWSLPAMLAWLAVTGGLALSGFFEVFDAVPPRFGVAIAPALLTAMVLATRPRVSAYLDSQPLERFITPQAFRIPVELVLWMLFLDGQAPALLTFDGRNWDIVAGVLAVAVTPMLRRSANRALAITYNVIAVALLVNIVAHGIGSTPTVLQVFVTDPPNVIMASWPMIWLPAFAVPAAFLLHFLSLRQALRHDSR